MKTIIRPETEMKDSGVEWIKYVPENWNCMPLKRYFQFGKGLPITKADLTKNGEKVISYGQIHAKFNTGVSVDDRLIRFVSSEYKSTNPNSLCSKGDIILADTSEDKEGCGNAVYIDCDEKIFAGYHTIILKSTKDNKYLAYLFQSDSWRTQIQTRVNGVKLFSITQKILNQCTIILPPLSEQQAIADYLDETCSKIDEIIAEAKASIDEYKELKQSVIFEVVTKGLDKNVEFIDSGDEWLGKYPKSYSIGQLSMLSNIVRGGSPRPAGDPRYYGGNIPFMRISDITKDDNIYVNSCENTITEEGLTRTRMIPSNTLLLTNSGATLGVPKINTFETTFNDGIAAFLDLDKRLNIIYVYFFLKARTSYFLEYASMGMGQPNLNTDIIGRTKIVFPTLAEQQKIVLYLKDRCKKLNSLIVEKESLINDLEAYKKSLIYEVVTGKRKVV